MKTLSMMLLICVVGLMSGIFANKVDARATDVTINIQDSNGNPLTGVPFSLWWSSGGEPAGDYTTNANGQFHLNLENGYYQLRGTDQNQYDYNIGLAANNYYTFSDSPNPYKSSYTFIVDKNILKPVDIFVQDAAGNGIPNISIDITSNTGESPTKQTVTSDSTGHIKTELLTSQYGYSIVPSDIPQQKIDYEFLTGYKGNTQLMVTKDSPSPVTLDYLVQPREKKEVILTVTDKATGEIKPDVSFKIKNRDWSNPIELNVTTDANGQVKVSLPVDQYEIIGTDKLTYIYTEPLINLDLTDSNQSSVTVSTTVENATPYPASLTVTDKQTG